MVRQLQEYFYRQRYAAIEIRCPDFVKLADAHGLVGLRVRSRNEIQEAVARARREPGTVVIDFQVEQADTVFPMVPAGADIHDMIRRPLPTGSGAEEA
jgi:acetolactate synthase-1/2/3 large subunit